MPEIKVTHDNRVRDYKIDHLYQVKKGDEGKALDAMKSDGADNIVFKADNGDMYIASSTNVPKGLRINDRIEIKDKGIRGTIWSFDTEDNTIWKTITHKAGWGAAIGGGLSLAGVGLALLKFGAAVDPLIALGAVAAGGLIGFGLSFLGKKKPDYDKLDKNSDVEIAMAKPGSAAANNTKVV
ncbi:MAG: hypothetical protein JWM80_1945 [Cyanobacteria bacterium RYN_339]|nr:hypothetical protein [Cyanobacteria bacterium RYN_339]